MNRARKTNSSRLLLGMTVALSLCATQPLYAYCAGGFVGGTATVYRCDNNCPDNPGRLVKYYKTGCVIICCPGWAMEYNPATCDQTTWNVSTDVLGRVNCCDPWRWQGEEYTGFDCAPAGE